MPLLTERAIVLGTNPLRENDLIVTLLTETTGRLSAVARSARASKKRFMGGVNLFDCGDFVLRPPKPQQTLYTLEQVENREHWPHMRDSLTAFNLAAYAIELATIFSMEGDADAQAIFSPLYRTLRALGTITDPEKQFAVTIFFNIKVLTLAGLDPLSSSPNLDPAVHLWLLRMQQKDQPCQAPSSQALTHAITWVSGFTEEVAGQALKTKNEVFKIQALQACA